MVIQVNVRTVNKIFKRAQRKIEDDIPLTNIENKVWTEIIKNNSIPFILEEKIRGMQELLESYISESEKKGRSCIPGDKDIAYGEEIRTLKTKLLNLKSSYDSMKPKRKYHRYQFKTQGDASE